MAKGGISPRLFITTDEPRRRSLRWTAHGTEETGMADSMDVNDSLDAPITGVTVFRDGARVTRSGQGIIPAGLAPLVLARLPVAADPESVRVAVRGQDVALLEVEA